MVFIISRVSRFLCGFFPVLTVITGFYLIKKKNRQYPNGKEHMAHFIGALLFCSYMFSVFFVTDIPDVFHFRLEPSINLIPFCDIRINTIQYFLNILLFVPLGFLLPALWAKFEKIPLTLFYGALLSLFIELMQLFNYRATDVDDLLMNVAGTMVGSLILRRVQGVFPGCSTFSDNHAPKWPRRPLVLVLIVWLCVFFIQPVLSGWLSGLLFGGRVIIG